MTPPGNQAVNREDKAQPVALERTECEETCIERFAGVSRRYSRSRRQIMKPRILAILLCFVVITGCSAVKPIPVEKISAINRIGVLSLLENKIRMQYVGLTVFNNFTEEIPVNEWGIDKYVIETFRDKINKGSQMKFISFNYEYEPFMKAYRTGFSSKDVSKELAEIAQVNSLDALVFVKRSIFQDPVTHDKHVSGYGIFQRSIAVVKRSALYLVAQATMYEVKTMEIIGEFSIYNNKKIDNDYFAKYFSGLPKEKKDYVESWIKQSLRERIQLGLMRLNVINTNEG